MPAQLNPSLVLGTSYPNSYSDFVQNRVVLDPYARTIISRRQYGQLGPDLKYGTPGYLGLMKTWPQAAAVVPEPQEASFDWEGDKPLGIPMEQLVGLHNIKTQCHVLLKQAFQYFKAPQLSLLGDTMAIMSLPLWDTRLPPSS